MPVRALRHTTAGEHGEHGGMSESINAREGIKTTAEIYKNGGLGKSESINAREGIKTDLK